MGFWYYYVLPLVTAILFVWLGNRVMVTKKWISIIFYSLAGVGYLIASVFAVFYIYATVEEILTPDILTKIGWHYFWSDNFIFLLTSIVLLTISYFVLKRGRLRRLRMK